MISVTREHFEKYVKKLAVNGSRYWNITKNLVLWCDPDARRILSKLFLIKIEEGDQL